MLLTTLCTLQYVVLPASVTKHEKLCWTGAATTTGTVATASAYSAPAVTLSPSSAVPSKRSGADTPQQATFSGTFHWSASDTANDGFRVQKQVVAFMPPTDADTYTITLSAPRMLPSALTEGPTTVTVDAGSTASAMATALHTALASSSIVTATVINSDYVKLEAKGVGSWNHFDVTLSLSATGSATVATSSHNPASTVFSYAE
jgi:hypothetical protein